MTGPDLAAFALAILTTAALLLRDRLHRHTWGAWAPLWNINYYDDGATMPTHRTTVLVRTCSTCGDSRSKEMRT